MADYQSIFEGKQIDEGIGQIINGAVDKAVSDAQAAAAQAAADAAKTAGIVAQASDKALLAESYAHGGTGILRDPLTLLDAKNIVWDAQKLATFPGTGTMPVEGKTYRVTVDGVAYDAAAVPLIPAVRSVGVSPAAATIAPGGTRQFTAVVAAENDAPTTVSWSISGATQPGTTISAGGLLTVGATETGPLTVKATSTFDATKTGTATITVEGKLAITGVTISPSYFFYISTDTTKQFTASVLPAGAPQGVTWSLSGATQAGTKLSATGLLSITSMERANLVVRATSTDDTTKFSSATAQYEENPPVDPDPPLEPPVRSMRAAPRAAATGYAITAGKVALIYKIAGNVWVLTTTDTAVKSVSVQLELGTPEGTDNAKYYAQRAETVVLQSVPLSGGIMSGTLVAPEIVMDGLIVSSVLRKLGELAGWKASPIGTFAALEAAVSDVYRGVNLFALDNVDFSSISYGTMKLRRNLSGHPWQKSQKSEFVKNVERVFAISAGYSESVRWDFAQYTLIHPDHNVSPSEAAKESAQLYWWKNSVARPIATLEDLLYAAYEAYGATPAQPGALDGLPSPTVLAGAPFWLRSEKENGTPYATDADVKAALQVAVATMKSGGIRANNVDSVTWKQLQHFMLGNTFANDAEIKVNYWWWNNGTKPVGIDADLAVSEIMLAATESCAEMGIGGDPTITTGLIQKYATALKFQNFGGGAVDAATLETAIYAMISEIYGNDITDMYNPDNFYAEASWNEVQYYLINGAAVSDESGTIPAYSWRPGGAKSLAMPLEVQRPADPMETPNPLPEPTVPEPPAEEVKPGLPPETAGDPPATMEEVKGEVAAVLTSATPAPVTPPVEEPVMAAPATVLTSAAPATAVSDPVTPRLEKSAMAAPKAAASDQAAPKTATSPAAFAAAATKTATTVPESPGNKSF